jgi:FdrA protein
MAISRQASSLDGVGKVMVLLGSESNKKVLGDLGLLDAAARAATANDLVISIDADTEEACNIALAEVDRFLSLPVKSSIESGHFRTVEHAIDGLAGANLVLFSVPGQFAKLDAAAALNRGLHVMIFSDNVPVEDEIYLKRLAEQRDLLMMGPDCGTAIINGVPLAFANVVRRGDIGIVGASGTGIQEVSSLIDRFHGGVSHAIGVGGRDLKKQVGGIMMRLAIRKLGGDPNTTCIVLISKPAEPSVMKAVLNEARSTGKRVVACILGAGKTSEYGSGVTMAFTLEEAALSALNLVQEQESVSRELRTCAAGLPATRRYLRGLFSGGTLCHEALLLFQGALEVYSNVSPLKELRLHYPARGKEHCCIDMGEDDFTRGRPHPMIDGQCRCERLIEEFQHPEVRVILLDVVLGHGAAADPAGEIAEALAEARRGLSAGETEPLVFAHVCGTERDPQSMPAQENKLRQAGVHLFSTNARAARAALSVVTKAV